MNVTYTQKKTCSQLRAQGRSSLRGKWAIAILAMIIAWVLGAQLATTGVISPGGSINFNFGDSDFSQVLEDSGIADMSPEEIAGMTAEDWLEIFGGELDGVELPDIEEDLNNGDWGAVAMGVLMGLCFVLIFVAIGLLIGLAFSLFVGTPMRIGHLRFRLELIDGAPGKLGTLFGGFGRGYWRFIGLRVVRAVYLFLWEIPAAIFGTISIGALVLAIVAEVFSLSGKVFSLFGISFGDTGTIWLVTLLSLLFFVGFSLLPVIARYRYAMSDYVLAENPDMTVGDALRESTRMMKGNKWRLFCLELSFIGWILLGCLSFGIGFIWIDPYMYQTEAAFYHEVSGREAIHEAIADMKELMAEL